MIKKFFPAVALAGVTVCVALVGGCSINGEPRERLGSYATPTRGTNFIDTNNLGTHCYENFLVENNGIVYTCRGGHIDIAHLRIAADYVRFLYNRVRMHLENNDSEFTFKMNIEPSKYFVKLKYPANWTTLSQDDKEKIIHEVSLELSQYFTFTMTTWHEVLTWFGFKSLAVLPEYPSSFSWEDSYSNLLGAILGARAVEDNTHSFNQAMTILVKQELETLQVQPARVARQASEKMRGKWYDGILLINMRERNMDIGIDDGFVTPTLVPGICDDAQPKSYPVSTLHALDKYGFAMTFEIEPREFERNKILRIVYPNGGANRIQPDKHLPLIMDYLRKDGIKKGYTVMPPKSSPGLTYHPPSGQTPDGQLSR